MSDDEQKAAERELVEHLRKHPEVVEAVKRAAPAWNDAARRQIAGREIPDPSRPTPGAVPSWLREPGALNSGVDYRRDRKDDEDFTRTRALERIRARRRLHSHRGYRCRRSRPGRHRYSRTHGVGHSRRLR